MGGLCIGSIGLLALKLRWLPSLANLCRSGSGDRRLRPLCSGPAFRCSTASMSPAPEHGLPGMLLRGLLCAVCLLPPTILMGASLPAIVRWIEIHAARRLLVGPAVRRQHGGRGVRMPAGGLLSAAHLRHGDRDVLARSRSTSLVAAASVTWLPRRVPRARIAAERTRNRTRGRRRAGGRQPDRAGQFTSPSRFPAPARWARKSSGRA